MFKKPLDIKYTCPCCGFKTHTNEDHSWEICKVCFWQSCPIGNVRVTAIVGPNPISLVEAQHNFVRFGACDKAILKHVRKPKPDEPKDENFRRIELVYFKRNHIVIVNQNNKEYTETTQYFFECDRLGDVKRQIQILDNGNIITYDEQNYQDVHGGLAEKPLDLNDPAFLKIDKTSFEKLWDKS